MPFFKPPLCKGRWIAEGETEGLSGKKAFEHNNSLSVSLAVDTLLRRGAGRG